MTCKSQRWRQEARGHNLLPWLLTQEFSFLTLAFPAQISQLLCLAQDTLD